MKMEHDICVSAEYFHVNSLKITVLQIKCGAVREKIIFKTFDPASELYKLFAFLFLKSLQTEYSWVLIYIHL